MTRYWTVLATASLATLLALFAPALVARADIFQWEYINPANPGLGKQPSALLCPGGAGAYAGPGANLSNRNLTKAYLIGADLSPIVGIDPESGGTYYFYSNLTGANLSQADLTYASLQSANVSEAILTGAEVRRANLDNTGITLAQLYSTASYVAKDLTGIRLRYLNLAGANLASQNLTDARFNDASLTGANLSGAEVRGTDFSRSGPLWGGITPAQLYSTASYQAHDLSGIGLAVNELAGANLAGQNLAGANFSGYSYGDEGGGYTIPANLTGANLSGSDARGANFYAAMLGGANLSYANLTNANFNGDIVYNAYADLTNANLSGADARGASFYLADLTGSNLSGADVRGANLYEATSLTGANTSNLIQSNGHIVGLDLTAGASLVVRDYDGYAGVGPLPIVVDGHLAMDATGALRLVFDADPWDSTISFAQGIPVARGGTLDLTFASDVNLASQVGRTIDLFDWTGVSPIGAFNISSPYTWNLTKLYTTGEVTLAALSVIPGDFNHDGAVDAADFAVWRKNPGGFPADAYATWRTHFGQPPGSGAGASANAAVPEPTTLVLVLVGTLALLSRRPDAVS